MQREEQEAITYEAEAKTVHETHSIHKTRGATGVTIILTDVAVTGARTVLTGAE